MTRRFWIIFCLIFSLVWASAATARMDNFLSAAKEADSFAIIETTPDRESRFMYLLPQGMPGESLATLEKNMPVFQHPGKYLAPVKDGVFLKYNPPYLQMDNPEEIYSLLAQFKLLPLRDEAGVLKNAILAPNLAPLRLIALKRLAENGFFAQGMDKETAGFYRELYFYPDLTVPEKNLLLEKFAQSNFLPMEEVYVIALSDESAWRLAGEIFARSKPESFAALMMKYAASDTLWLLAVRQSRLMIGYDEFARILLSRYNYEEPMENHVGFIPLLLTSKYGASKNQAAIRSLLTGSKNTNSYELYRSIGEWLNKIDPTPYREELKKFLRNNRHNNYIKDGIIYPSMLAALYKTQDPAGIGMSLDYLRELKKRKQPQLVEMVCILFKKAHQSNPSLDEIIIDLELQKAKLK